MSSKKGSFGAGMATEEQLDQPEEFLPLPISEQYKLPSKKPRRAGGQTLMTGGRPHGPIGQPSPAGGEPEPELSPEERERLRCAADVRATLEAVGLGEEAAAHSEAAIGQARPASKKQKKGSRKSAAPLDAADTAGKLQKKTGQSKKQSNQPAQQGDVPQAGTAARGAAPVTEDDVIPFDFAAARASAGGLDISGVIGGRGRGGRGGRGTRGGGRGGRDRRSGAGRDGGERGTKRKGFNPWDAIQEEAVKGGKRSAVMPRSGNRTMTFG